MSTNEDTVKSYDASAAEYAEEAAAMPEWVAREIDAFVDAVGGTGRILEIGSGGGRDALVLERRGLRVRCTDVAQGFVDLLRADGFEADRLDPLTDDLADPQRPDTLYDGVWSCACLFHVAREDLVTVLGRLAKATRSGGRIHASFKEGDGEECSTCGTPDAPRRYTDTLWREPDLRSEFSARDGSSTRSADMGRSRGSLCGGTDHDRHTEFWSRMAPGAERDRESATLGCHERAPRSHLTTRPNDASSPAMTRPERHRCACQGACFDFVTSGLHRTGAPAAGCGRGLPAMTTGGSCHVRTRCRYRHRAVRTRVVGSRAHRVGRVLGRLPRLHP